MGSIFFFLLTVFSVFLSFPFYHIQFLSNFFKYFFLNFPSSHPYNNFAVYLPSNSTLLKSFSSANSNFSYFFISIFPLKSFTNFLAFFKFSFLSQLSFSAVNLFYCTRYFTTSLSFFLFKTFSISYSSTSSTFIGFTSSFLCPSTCILYHTTWLIFTTRWTLIDVNSCNLTILVDTISSMIYKPT